MYLGDNLLEQDLAAFVAAFASGAAGDEPPAAQILLKRVPDPHRFGIATLDGDGHVVALVEKPSDPPSDLALVGVYLFTPRVHDAVAAIEPSARASSRSPTPSSGWSTKASACAASCSPGGGSTPAS